MAHDTENGYGFPPPGGGCVADNGADGGATAVLDVGGSGPLSDDSDKRHRRDLAAGVAFLNNLGNDRAVAVVIRLAFGDDYGPGWYSNGVATLGRAVNGSECDRYNGPGPVDLYNERTDRTGFGAFPGRDGGTDFGAAGSRPVGASGVGVRRAGVLFGSGRRREFRAGV